MKIGELYTLFCINKYAVLFISLTLHWPCNINGQWVGHKPPRERIQYSTWNPGPSFPTRARSKKTLFVKLFIAVMGEADRQEALVGTWEREWDPPPLPAALPATLLVCLPSAPACLPRNASVHMIQFFCAIRGVLRRPFHRPPLCPSPVPITLSQSTHHH